MPADRRAGYARGLVAEGIAAWLLRLKGYRVLATRYRTPLGEIDIVARRGKVLAFVEVKARPTVEALAIDVYKTASDAGYPIRVCSDRTQEMNRYAILLVD